MKVLLVEDNHDLAVNVCEFLEDKGHVVDYAANGTIAVNLALKEIYDAIVLDLMLPGIDGYSVCEQIREQTSYQMPIIMLTARDKEQDKLKGFKVGADDYLIKPFSLPELEARLIALKRRSGKVPLKSNNLVVADLVYNAATMNLTCAGVRLILKPVPRKILVMLMGNANRVVTRQEIEHEIWKDDLPDSEVLRSHIYAIRSELNKYSSHELLITKRGVGYILDETNS